MKSKFEKELDEAKKNIKSSAEENQSLNVENLQMKET
jgi:regulator of replication initiation timing